MGTDLKEGQIITIEDFMDTVVKYLMPPVPNYGECITIIFANGIKWAVRKGIMIGYFHNKEYAKYVDGEEHNTSKLKVGDLIFNSNFHYSGTDYVYHGDARKSPTLNGKNYLITKIVDPSDNTIFDGIDKHTFEAKMPVPGELISVVDVKNILVNTGAKMYMFQHRYQYEWYNVAYQNRKNCWPDFNDPGMNQSSDPGDGWRVKRSWYCRILKPPKNVKDGLYAALPTNLKFAEDDLITYLQLQNALSVMYNTNNFESTPYYMHHLTCHDNCHHNCHCVRW